MMKIRERSLRIEISKKDTKYDIMSRNCDRLREEIRLQQERLRYEKLRYKDKDNEKVIRDRLKRLEMKILKMNTVYGVGKKTYQKLMEHMYS